jgi:hypothetical protein
MCFTTLRFFELVLEVYTPTERDTGAEEKRRDEGCRV